MNIHNKTGILLHISKNGIVVKFISLLKINYHSFMFLWLVASVIEFANLFLLHDMKALKKGQKKRGRRFALTQLLT